MEPSKLLWGQPDKMLGGNLRWISIPSRESRNTPSRFIPQKPEISAGTDEPSGSPNYDWELSFTSILIITKNVKEFKFTIIIIANITIKEKIFKVKKHKSR